MSTQTVVKNSDVKDLSLASQGKQRIEWAEREMPVAQIAPSKIFSVVFPICRLRFPQGSLFVYVVVHKDQARF